MRRNHNSILGIILVVMIGLFVFSDSVLADVTVLNRLDAGGTTYYGNFGTVSLEVTPGEADFTITHSLEGFLSFTFFTSLTLYPENFVRPDPNVPVVRALPWGYPSPIYPLPTSYPIDGIEGTPPPDGTPITGYIQTGALYAQPNPVNNPPAPPALSIILNPDIISEDQFGSYFLYGLDYDPLRIANGIVLSSEVPEPATLLLLGSGLLGFAGYGRKKFFKK